MVSVIILNYNTFDMTKRCMESIYEKTAGVDFEIILVDNGSRECPPHTFLNFFPHIKIVALEKNVGFAKGVNAGIPHASGNYILLLNSDTILLNNAIKICSEYLNGHSDVGVVGCRIENPDGSPQHSCLMKPSITSLLGELLRLHKIIPGWGEKHIGGWTFSYDKEYFPDMIWGTFFMFRREILERFPEHKLPEVSFMYYEDFDWCLAIKNMGYKIAFVPQARILHYDIRGNSNEKQELLEKGAIQFLMRHHNPLWVKTYIMLSKLVKFSSIRYHIRTIRKLIKR